MVLQVWSKRALQLTTTFDETDQDADYGQWYNHDETNTPEGSLAQL
jgi:hypothetical protein